MTVWNVKDVKGRVMRVSGAAVKQCGETWVGVAEWEGQREGRRTPGFLLELIHHTAPAQNLTKSGLWTTPN